MYARFVSVASTPWFNKLIFFSLQNWTFLLSSSRIENPFEGLKKRKERLLG